MEKFTTQTDELYEEYSRTLTEFFERMNSWEQSVVSETSVSLAQMHLIEVIGNRGQMRMKELAEILGVTTGTLTVMAHRLEEKGFIYRSKDKQDKRSYFIGLSDKGKQEYRHHHHMHFHLIEEIVDALGKKEAKEFFTHLKKLRDSI